MKNNENTEDLRQKLLDDVYAGAFAGMPAREKTEGPLWCLTDAAAHGMM